MTSTTSAQSRISDQYLRDQGGVLCRIDAQAFKVGLEAVAK